MSYDEYWRNGNAGPNRPRFGCQSGAPASTEPNQASTLMKAPLGESARSRRPVLWTVGEVSDVLRLEPETIRKRAREGRMPGAVMLGRQWRFEVDQILGMLKPVPSRI